MQRYIRLDVCDYTGTSLCNLYDSAQNISGQAHDVIVHTERNGYKELRFELPSVLQDGEDNYRYEYLISDYRIRLLVSKGKDLETDWFLISESRINHNSKSKNYEVKATHISQLLNMKNLDLEFSDDEGNNSGTIGQIAELILEGTGWHLGDVRHFYESEKYGYQKDQVEKVRTFRSSAQTGAFKMMSDLCELFDAKPIYHGYGKYIENGQEKYGRTVDIIPMNPFSEDFEQGTIPPDILEDQIIELYYEKNVKDISRTLNTDTITTRLTAYGSLGDRDGCSLMDAVHPVIRFATVVTPGEYCFIWQNSKFYFTADVTTDSLVWNALDFSSRSYVYDGTNLFRVYKEPKGNATQLEIIESYEKNYLPYLMDFTYYDKVGLLNDNMLRDIANHQWTMPSLRKAAFDASEELEKKKAELLNTASSNNGFLMLDIKAASEYDGNVRLVLDKGTYSDGVIFRSDYDSSKRNYFQWNVAVGIKLNKEAIAGKGALVYIVHQGDPTKYERAYVKYIAGEHGTFFEDLNYNKYLLSTIETYEDMDHFPAVGQPDCAYKSEDSNKLYAWTTEYVEIRGADYIYGIGEFEEPDSITLWIENEDNIWQEGDKVYLFSADSIAGLFGPREDQVMSNIKSVEETIKQNSVTRPLYFITNDDEIPPVDACLNSYGWYYHNNDDEYSLGDLHFCWGENGDGGWSNVYISTDDDNPEKLNPDDLPSYGYYYSIKNLMLYKVSSKDNEKYWEPIKGTVDKDKITASFASVITGCINQEVLTKGIKEEYYYDRTDVLPIGDYAFENEFGNYWLFTTTKVINPETGDQLRYKYADKLIWQDDDERNVVKAFENSFMVLKFPSSNDMFGVSFSDSNYNDGVFSTGTTYKVSNNIYVHANVNYEFFLPQGSKIICLDVNNRMTTEKSTSPFLTPANTTHVRIVSNTVPTNSHWLRVVNYNNVLFSKDRMYTLLHCESSGKRTGLNYLMNQFVDLAHQTYEVYLPALQNAQKNIQDAENYLKEQLGDIFREGVWRKEDYVKDDEQKLYSDTLDNLKEVSHPQATYDVTFLDRYGSQPLMDDEDPTLWPDIEISYAAHLVDTDIDTNKWAYIDVLDKCYDMPWKTTMEINTRLSMIGQQSFTDVLTRIAEIANETKANQSVYKRAEALTSSGHMAAERLEGAISANKLLLTGATSNWYTDSKGNIIFESADGSAAMMLSGKGWAISKSKDIYGDFDWRYMATPLGLTADAIYTGYLSAERLEAGSITTDKLSSSVGQELEIGSNVALTMYATADGTRPAGSLITQHPNEGDSWISIQAKNGNTPAHIDIQSGGTVNLYGASEMTIGSDGTLNLSGATTNLTSNGKLIVSGGTVDIRSNGVLLINSENFKIIHDSITDKYNVTVKGNITTTGGNIAGFIIANHNNIDYMYAGQTTSVTSDASGVYLGTNGINIGGVFKVSADGSTTYFKTTASNIMLGNTSLETIHTGFNTGISNAQSAAEGAQSTADSKSQTFRCTSAQIVSKPYKVGDVWVCTDTKKDKDGNNVCYYYQYVCKQISTTRNATTDWTLTGTAILGGAKLAIDTENGTIDMIASNDINIVSGATINVAASKKLSLTTAGTIEIGNGGSPFTIGSDGTDAYIRNGVTSMADTSHNGIYVGTNGIRLGKGLFNVTSAGALTSTSGNIAGWTINSTSLTGNKTGLAKTTNDTDIAIWAGNATASSAPFRVTQAGALTSTSGSIAGWTINSTSLTGNKTGLAKTTNDTDVAIWAGNATASSAPFRVTQAGAVTATNADIKGAIKATSLYIGSTSSSNGTQLKLDSNGLVMNNSVTAGDAVRATAGITINADTGVVISSSGTAGATSATKISTLTVSNGKVNISCTDVGNSSSTGIYISPTKIQAKSTGDVDFSAAKSLSLKAGSVALTALASTNLSDYNLDHIGDATGIYITPTKITAKSTGDVDFSAAKSFKIAAGAITMSNISDYTPPDLTPYALKTGTYAIQTGIAIGSSGIDISGNKYVKIASGSQFQVTATGFGVNSTSTDYVLWAGGSSATATGSKFRVKADGTVYLTQLVAVGEDGTETTVNLRTSNLWKLGYHTIKNYTVSGNYCTKMTLSNGVSLNFNGAASVTLTGTWSGNKFTVTNSGNELKSEAEIEYVNSLSSIAATLFTAQDHTATMSVKDTNRGNVVLTQEYDGTPLYNAVYSAAQNTMVLGLNATDHTVSVVKPSGSTGAKTMSVTATADPWDGTTATIRANIGGVTIATDTVSAEGFYKNGWNACRDGCAGYSNIASKTLDYDEIAVVSASMPIYGGGNTVIIARTFVAPSDRYNQGWNDALSAATAVTAVTGFEYIGNYTLYKGNYPSAPSAGTGVWRLGGNSGTYYILPDPK